MTVFATPTFSALAATGVLVQFGDAIDRTLSLLIAAFVERLDARDEPGIVDLIPSYTTVVMQFDPEETDGSQLHAVVESIWSELSDTPDVDAPQAREISIPVVYGGEYGPDLDEIAEHTGLSSDDVIRRHHEATYTVGALGFAPGFAFLIGLPPELETPRRSSPRTRVPPGSVAIGGAQTGIYSFPTPGGWSLIGRTPRVMFDPERQSEDELRPGDRIRFVPTSAAEAPPFGESAPESVPTGFSTGALEIAEGGVQTSVQDLGRPGQGRHGITPGGALDRSALIAGNRLLGNPDGAAALEWSLLPPTIRFQENVEIVMTGADPGWRVGDAPMPIGELVTVGAGEEVRADPSRRIVGARGYLCVAGGIDVPEVRQSRALDLSAGFGGGYGRPLKRGDRLPIERRQSDSPLADNQDIQGTVVDPASDPFRVTRGPQAERFDEAAWPTFLSEAFTVDAQSNRMGLRLNGPTILPHKGADVISEGLVTGAIQITGSGQPIVLLAGRATIGGYTKIATVIEADHDRLGQLPPGATVRFDEVSQHDAREALLQASPSIHGALWSRAGEDAAMSSSENEACGPLAGDLTAWTPAGVIELIRELTQQDVRAFSLRVESAGIDIAIDRGGGLPERAPLSLHSRTGPVKPDPSPGTKEDGDSPNADNEHIITAPLIGTFFRRPSPDEPEFVREGDSVAAGETVGIIEVMKSFHDVTAPQAGTIGKMLVENGDTVEFGQGLMELDPEVEG